MNHFANIWEGQRIEKLIHLARDHSATELAAIFGVTRNAIIGICHRKGIETKKLKPRKAPKAMPVSPIRQNGPLSLSFLSWKAKPMPLEKIIAPGSVEWPPEHGKCCAVLGDPRARPVLACGQPVKSTSVYCANHHAAFYVPVVRR